MSWRVISTVMMLTASALLAGTVGARAQDTVAVGNAAVLAQQCNSCHAEAAVGRRIPPLSGVDQNQIVSAMEDFRVGRRDNPAMMSVARNLSPQEVEEIARYFSEQPLAGD